jgi:HAD superfamily hydrolase (TIGR01509 family)
MTSAPAAVAFDVDGTLVDSEPLHLQALQAVCAAHGVDLSAFGPTPFIGVGIHEVWRLLAPHFGDALGQGDERREQAFRGAIAEHYRAGLSTLRPMPGATEALLALAERDVPMGAVSNSERAIVEANLRAIGARELMRFVITLDDVVQAKPHAEPYQRAAIALALPASQVLAVEDSPSGLQSARAAGLRVVLLVGHAEPAAWQRTADHTLTNLHGLLPWWQQQARLLRVTQECP